MFTCVYCIHLCSSCILTYLCFSTLYSSTYIRTYVVLCLPVFFHVYACCTYIPTCIQYCMLPYVHPCSLLCSPVFILCIDSAFVNLCPLLFTWLYSCVFSCVQLSLLSYVYVQLSTVGHVIQCICDMRWFCEPSICRLYCVCLSVNYYIGRFVYGL